MSDKAIGLVYFGRMGAGSKITYIIAKQLCARGIEVRLVVSSNLVDLNIFEELKVPIHLVSMSAYRPLAFVPFESSKNAEVFEFLRLCSLVFFPMPHPRDNQVVRSLINGGLYVGRAIHDSARHPGDIWPNKFSTVLQKRYSDFLVAHSQYVAGKVSSDKVSVIPLPNLTETIVYKPIQGLVVFVGRLRAYKGLKILTSAWGDVSSKDPAFHLLIAGSGKSKIKVSSTSVSLEQKWLSEDEIIALISRANCLVFPYIEASQSGLLPLIDSLEIPLVVTDVGGLREQVFSSSSQVVRPDRNEIASAILKAIDSWELIESSRTAKEEAGLAEFLIDTANSLQKKTP